MILLAVLFAIQGLPLVEVPPRQPGDYFAVIISGDGGWRKIDKVMAEGLSAHDIPTVGLDAAAYFRTRRTPEEAAAALEWIIRQYSAQWHRQKALLIGYSRGADALPFMINRLPDDLRPSISAIALLGLEPTIDFKYNPWWTLARHHHSKEEQLPVQPEVEKLRGQNVLCIYGVNERDSLCPLLDRGAFTIIPEPGSHHFAGRYRPLVEQILAKAR